MANTLRIKRRTSGTADAPSSLANAELSFNEVNDVLWYGKGTGGAGGSATTVIAIGGAGSFMTLGTTQNITGDKTFSGAVALGSNATATTLSTGEDSNKLATTAWVKSLPVASSTASFITASAESALSGERVLTGSSDVTITDNGANGTIVIGLAASGVTAGTYPKVTVDSKGRVTAASALAEGDIPAALARLASPTFTGVPLAPTAALGTNTTQIASAAFVQQEIAALIAAAPGTLDTLNELAAALGNDPNFVTTITTSISGKLAKSSNLSDLVSPSTARTNLGLAIGTNVQAYSAKLAAIDGLTYANNKGFYATGTNTFATYDLTSFGRSQAALSDASAGRTLFGLGSIATQNANNVTITGGSIDNIVVDGGTF